MVVFFYCRCMLCRDLAISSNEHGFLWDYLGYLSGTVVLYILLRFVVAILALPFRLLQKIGYLSSSLRLMWSLAVVISLYFLIFQPKLLKKFIKKQKFVNNLSYDGLDIVGFLSKQTIPKLRREILVVLRIFAALIVLQVILSVLFIPLYIIRRFFAFVRNSVFTVPKVHEKVE